jgi:hypothetical protein
MQAALNKATGDLGKVKGYQTQKTALDQMSAAHAKARENVRQLASALMAADAPTKRMQAAYAAATASVDKLGSKLDWQKARVRGAADALGAMGVNVRNLAAGEAQLRAATERATAAIVKQEAAAARSATRRQAAGTIAGGAATLAGIKGVQTGKDAFKSAGNIDYALRQQQFATGLSKAQQDSVLYPQAKRIGQDTKFTNEDIVRAQTEFANGLPAAIKQAGVIASVIDQAKNYALTVKDVDMQQAAMAVRGYLLSMGKDISSPEKAELEARGATNKMIRATKIGGLTHDDLMPFIARGASAGRIAGLSEETLLALAVGLKRSNISGDQAGTAVRTASSKLVAPTPKGIAGLTAAGIDYDSYTTMPGGLSVENFAKKFKQDFGKSLSSSARDALTEAFADPDIVGDRGAFAKAVTDAVSPLFTPKADGTMRASDARTVAKKAGDFHKFSVESVDAERLLTDIIKADPTLGVLNAFMTDKHGNKFALLAKSLDQFEADKKDLKGISPSYGDDASKLIQGGLGGAIERMTGAVETFKTTLGKENEGWLTPVTNKVGDAIDMLTRGVEKSPLFAACAGALATGAAGIGGAFKLANDLAGGNLPAIALTGSAAALTKSAFALDAAAAKMALTGPAGDVLKKAGPLAAAGITAMGAASAAAIAAGAAIVIQDYKPALDGVTKGNALPGQEHDDGQRRRRSANEIFKQRMDKFRSEHGGDGSDPTAGSPFIPRMDTSGLDRVKDKTAEVRDELTGLSDTTVAPQANTGPLDDLLRKVQQIRAELAAINGAAGAAKSAVAGIGASTAGRGRSDVATATANLSRSRQTNNTGREFTG